MLKHSLVKTSDHWGLLKRAVVYGGFPRFAKKEYRYIVGKK